MLTDFAASLRQAPRPGDFVYLDPPYQPLSATSAFTSYTKDGFGIREQRRLRDVFDDLTARGVPALLSNSDHAGIRDLYDGYLTQEVSMGRNINSKAAARSAISELLISNFDSSSVAEGLGRDADEHERHSRDAAALPDDVEQVALVIGDP